MVTKYFTLNIIFKMFCVQGESGGPLKAVKGSIDQRITHTKEQRCTE